MLNCNYEFSWLTRALKFAMRVRLLAEVVSAEQQLHSTETGNSVFLEILDWQQQEHRHRRRAGHRKRHQYTTEALLACGSTTIPANMTPTH